MQNPTVAEFGWGSTADEVLAGHDLTGTRALITGISAGIGLETARALHAGGAQVVGAVRNLAKAREALARAGMREGAGIELAELDLASLASVRSGADALAASGQNFNLFIANAGMMAARKERTAEGFESMLAGNYLGHFVLLNRLSGRLAPGGRAILLSSVAHRFADIDLDDLNFEHRKFDIVSGYGAAKTAIALFVAEFDRRHTKRGVRAAAVHPGPVSTDLAGSMSPELIQEMMAIMLAEDAGANTAAIKTIAQGAATTLWAAVTAPAEMIGGKYCEDCGIAPVSAEGSTGVQPYAIDPARAEALWQATERLVQENFG